MLKYSHVEIAVTNLPSLIGTCGVVAATLADVVAVVIPITVTPISATGEATVADRTGNLSCCLADNSYRYDSRRLPANQRMM